MSNYVRYHGETNRGPSPIIFGDPAKRHHDMLMGKCIFAFDDFAAPPVLTNAGASGNPYTYQDTGVTIEGMVATPDLANEMGVLAIVHDGTDNDEGAVQFGSGYLARIANSAGNTGKLMFEARVKTNTIADNGLAFFVGLGEGKVADNYLVNDDGTLITTKAFLGFRRLQDDGAHADIIYQAASQTLQTVEANALTLVANTWYKLGFVYDPGADDAKKITFYIDGVDAGSYVTTTNIDAATFPEDEALVPMILTHIGTGTAFRFDIDWYAFCQYQDGEE